jgi:hypothetical protein
MVLLYDARSRTRFNTAHKRNPNDKKNPKNSIDKKLVDNSPRWRYSSDQKRRLFKISQRRSDSGLSPANVN